MSRRKPLCGLRSDSDSGEAIQSQTSKPLPPIPQHPPAQHILLAGLLMVLSWLQDGVAMLWDLAEGKRLYSLDAGDVIHALCFSPNRYWLCAATQACIKVLHCLLTFCTALLQHRVMFVEIPACQDGAPAVLKSSCPVAFEAGFGFCMRVK